MHYCRYKSGGINGGGILVCKNEKEVSAQVRNVFLLSATQSADNLDSLIMILIVGDILRSLFLFVFPLVSLVKGHIQTDTAFCQVGIPRISCFATY
jgi:hypothetical protein